MTRNLCKMHGRHSRAGGNPFLPLEQEVGVGPRLRGDDGAAKSAPKIRLRNWFRLGACFLAFWLAPLAAEAAPASAAVPDSIEAEASEN